MNIIESLFGTEQSAGRALSILNRANRNLVFTTPLYGAARSFFILNAAHSRKQFLILSAETKEMNEIEIELKLLEPKLNIIKTESGNPEKIQDVLSAIAKDENFILLAPYELLDASLPAKNILETATTRIEVGGGISYDDLISYLIELKFTNEEFVENPGEFSLRGSIIDFWSFSERSPARIEFDGDFIESIRYFDFESQRSIERVNSVSLSAKVSESSPLNNATIFDYLHEPVVLCRAIELERMHQEKVEIVKHNYESPEELQILSEIIGEENIPEDVESVSQAEISEVKIKKNVFDFLAKQNADVFIEDEFGVKGERFNFELATTPIINGKYEILFETVKKYCNDGFKTIIATENDLQTKRLTELLSEINNEIENLLLDGRLRIVTMPVKSGFINKKNKTLFLTDYEIFNKPFRTKIPAAKKISKARSKDLSSIKIGDYLVHEAYGIGKYSGLHTIKIGEVNQESMKLLYNDGGVVYVNLNYLHLVKKYSSKEGLTPTLSTLGTGEWTNTKKKTKKRIKEFARDLIRLYAQRKSAQGFSFSQDTIWQNELEASFIYEDTPDQVKVTDEVKQDMQASNPMDRLVCGDVGFGKTEIAVRAAFKAVQDGKQVAALVPTTILAEQHFNTFSDRLSQFPVKIAALSRFQTKAEQNKIVKDLTDGNIDIVIGTHRLLSKDVKFKELGLLIIDEEHRFGVSAKDKLKSFKVNVDCLTLTATPIPRTLNLSLLGARDLSIIATPPPNRQPIYTIVDIFDIEKIKHWISKELNRNGQIYFVHDRVSSIEKLSSYILKYMPHIKIGVAHGQMKPAQLEEVIHSFMNRKFDVLLSTKIIESGIDIPNVNTMIVNRADRFGLAELHQLRGRVGRSDRQAYAYFLVPSMSGINKRSIKRLQAIEEFAELGSGFSLSMRDLEIRGAGNLLGNEQSGFISEVGFDLYLKMINEAVEELKTEEFNEIFKQLPKTKMISEPTIDTHFELGIPKSFMPEQMDRLSFYTSLYSVASEDELNEIIEELKDRFGDLPERVRLLIDTARLRFYASHALFARVRIQQKLLEIFLPESKGDSFFEMYFKNLLNLIVTKYKDKIAFSQKDKSVKLQIVNRWNDEFEAIHFLIDVAKEVSLIVAKGNEVSLN